MELTNAQALKKIKEHIERGTYKIARHAISRQQERLITMPEVIHVLQRGKIDSKRCGWDVMRQEHKFAVFGRTISGVDIEVIVAISNQMTIITVFTR